MPESVTDDQFIRWLSDDFRPLAQSHGCMCRFPRFRHLVQFFHTDYGAGPVMCRETETLIHHIFRGERLGYTITSRDTRGRFVAVCSTCHTEWAEDYDEYSISFYRTFARPNLPCSSPAGATVVDPFPLIWGFGGFQQTDIATVMRRFRLSTLSDFATYMTALA